MSETDRWENEGGRVIRTKTETRLRALIRRHFSLDRALDEELGRPNPCSIELQRLRREKLFLKDEMNQISR